MNTSHVLRRIIPAALTLALAAPAAVSAQGVPLRSSVVPWDAPALRADAFSLRSNAASMVFLRGAHSGVVVRGDFDGVGQPAVGWHSAYGFGKLFGIGAGIDAYGDSTAATWGLGFGSDAASIGFASTRWFSDDIGALDGFTTTQLSLALRASNALAFGFLVDNLTTPRMDGVPVSRAFVPSVAARTANGRFELNLQYRATPRGEADTIGATVVARPVDGIRVYASTAVSTDTGVDDASGHGGLEFAFGAMSVTAGGGVTYRNGEATPGFVTAFEVASRGIPGFVSRDRFVRIDLSGDFAETPSFALGGAQPVFTDLLVQIDELTHDPVVGGIFLSVGGVTAGTAQLDELRNALLNFQAAGKTVVAYLERASVRDLYLAGHADVVVAAPTLSVLNTGIGITRTYFGDLFAMFNVEAQFVRIGEFKSGPERFTENGPTEASQAQIDAYLDTTWAHMREGIAENFSLSEDDADALLNDAPLFADALLNAGHIDAVLYRDELNQALDDLVGRPVRVVAQARPDTRGDYWFEPNEIAVLHISGTIVLGNSGDGLFGYRTGSDTITAVARQLAADDDVRAVIVRIDSPGGSAEASDRIHRALAQLADAKPTVVSMGDVAASGGMYAAAFGTEIYAAPTTLTGSIGIYAGTVAVEGLLARAGVDRVRDERGGPSDLFEGRRWSDEELERVQAHIQNAYDRFVRLVAEGRGMTEEEVDAVGQGHIWSGSAAVSNGLVDSADGFLGALAYVRAEAQLGDAPFSLAHYPSARPSLFALFPDSPHSRLNATVEELSAVASTLGLHRLFAVIAPMLSDTVGAPMAQLQWEMDGL